MFAHEYMRYCNVVPQWMVERGMDSGCQTSTEKLLPVDGNDERPSVRNRVLCNTSLLWAASTLVQVSIACALNAEIWFTETGSDFSELFTLVEENGINIIGLAPTVVKQLAKAGSASSGGGGSRVTADQMRLPRAVELVFTWGEKLSYPLAVSLLSNHRKCCGPENRDLQIRNLLIATEYWLFAFEDPAKHPGLLRVVDVTDSSWLNSRRGSVPLPGEVKATPKFGVRLEVKYGGTFSNTSVAKTCVFFAPSLQYCTRVDLTRRVRFI